MNFVLTGDGELKPAKPTGEPSAPSETPAPGTPSTPTASAPPAAGPNGAESLGSTAAPHDGAGGGPNGATDPDQPGTEN